jgi:hypothetical protein
MEIKYNMIKYCIGGGYMKVINRLILSVYALFIAVVTILLVIAIVAFETDNISLGSIGSVVIRLIGNRESVMIILAILVVLFIISMRIAIRGSSDGKERVPIVKSAEGGEIEISLNTFENIAISTLRKVSDARDYSAKVKKINENVAVVVNMSVVQDVNIPELSQSVQTQVIEAIQSTTGVKVLNVKIRIDNVSPVFKSKLE